MSGQNHDGLDLMLRDPVLRNVAGGLVEDELHPLRVRVRERRITKQELVRRRRDQGHVKTSLLGGLPGLVGLASRFASRFGPDLGRTGRARALTLLTLLALGLGIDPGPAQRLFALLAALGVGAGRERVGQKLTGL